MIIAHYFGLFRLLSSNQLCGSIPSSIANLKNLKELYVYYLHFRISTLTAS